MANANELVPIANPLLIDVVVHKLFEYLSLKDTIKQRRVCKLWEEIGLKHLGKDIDLIKISFEPEKTVEKFLEMAKSSSFKFTRFALSYWKNDSDPRIQEAEQTLNILFEEYGSHMKVIELNLREATNSWAFLSDVLVNKAPNLERLCLKKYLQKSEATGLFSGKMKPKLKLKHMTLVWQDEANEIIYSQTLLEDLFACSPYLESFAVGFVIDDVVTLNNFGIVAILKIFAEKGNVSNLTTLSTNVGDEGIIEVLATSFKSAPLESFFAFVYRIASPMLPYMETFLDDHKDTLKYLSFTCPCVESFESFPFPTMNNLEVLSIYGWCFDKTRLRGHWVPFQVVDFGKVFPSLRTLRLYEDPRASGHRFFLLEEMFSEETTPVLTLKNLELPGISRAIVLRRIGRIFPNVLKLKLASQTPHVLRELWTTWPEIKTLHISILPYPCYRFPKLNSIFTGVDSSDYSRNFPSIRRLKKLKHLTVGGGPSSSDGKYLKYVKLKDETAYLALAEMKELVSLQISSDRHEISPSCVRYLCTELGMSKIEKEAEDRALHLVKYEWQKQSSNTALLEYE